MQALTYPTSPEADALDDEFFDALDRGIARFVAVADDLDDSGREILTALRLEASALRTITARPRLRLVATGEGQ